MRVVIAHWDSDGIGCVSTFFKKMGYESTKVFFTSATKLKVSLCKFIASIEDLDSVFIFDISPNQKTIILSSVFNNAFWIDHHKLAENLSVPNNVKIFVKEGYESATKVVSEYFSIDNGLVKIINEIDTNDVKSEEAKFLRDLVSSIKLKARGNVLQINKKFLFISKFLSIYEVSELMKREEEKNLVNYYRDYISQNIEKVIKTKKEFNVNGKRIIVLEPTISFPVYEIFNFLSERESFDMLAVLMRRIDLSKNLISTKIELRGISVNVFNIAKKFNGGGHEKAAGASVNKFITAENFIEEIKDLV